MSFYFQNLMVLIADSIFPINSECQFASCEAVTKTMWKDFIKGNAHGTEVEEKPGKAGKSMRSLFESDPK